MSINLKYLESVTGGNKDFIGMMLSVFIDKTPSKIELLSSAVEANDKAVAALYAHQLKTSFRTIGSNDVGDRLEQIEISVNSNSDGVIEKDIYQTLEKEMLATVEEIKKIQA